MQFVFENLVFPFQFNEMRLNCHTKPPRLGETSDSIWTSKCTREGESVDGYRKLHFHISPSSVTNREQGTRPSLRVSPAGTILPERLIATFRNLIAFFS